MTKHIHYVCPICHRCSIDMQVDSEQYAPTRVGEDFAELLLPEPE